MEQLKSILTRFLKGIIAGAVSAMGLITIQTPTVWSNFSSIFNNLGIAAVFGGLTGLLLALEKWANWQDSV